MNKQHLIRSALRLKPNFSKFPCSRCLINPHIPPPPSTPHDNNNPSSLFSRSFSSFSSSIPSHSSSRFVWHKSHDVLSSNMLPPPRSYTTKPPSPPTPDMDDDESAQTIIENDPVLNEVQHLAPLEQSIDQLQTEAQHQLNNGNVDMCVYLADRCLLLVQELYIKGKELEGEEARRLILDLAQDIESEVITLRAMAKLSRRTDDFLQEEELKSVEKDLARALVLTNSSSVACFNYATFLIMAHRYGEAVKWLTKSMKQNPEGDNVSAHFMRAESILASAEQGKRPLTQSELSRVMGDATRAIVGRYRSQEAYFFRGRIIYENHRLGSLNTEPEEVWNLSQALEDLSYSIDIFPLNPAVYRYRALVHRLLGQDDLADKDLKHIQDKFSGTIFSDEQPNTTPAP